MVTCQVCLTPTTTPALVSMLNLTSSSTDDFGSTSFATFENQSKYDEGATRGIWLGVGSALFVFIGVLGLVLHRQRKPDNLDAEGNFAPNTLLSIETKDKAMISNIYDQKIQVDFSDSDTCPSTFQGNDLSLAINASFEENSNSKSEAGLVEELGPSSFNRKGIFFTGSRVGEEDPFRSFKTEESYEPHTYTLSSDYSPHEASFEKFKTGRESEGRDGKGVERASLTVKAVKKVGPKIAIKTDNQSDFFNMGGIGGGGIECRNEVNVEEERIKKGTVKKNVQLKSQKCANAEDGPFVRRPSFL